MQIFRSRGITFLELLVVLFFILLMSSFLSFSVWKRKDRESGLRTLNECEHIFFSAKRMAQRRNKDIYLCLIPDQALFDKNHVGVFKNSFVLAEQKNIKDPFVTMIDECFHIREKMTFDPISTVSLKIRGRSFKVPAILFLSSSGQLLYPPIRKAKEQRHLRIKIQGESDFLEINPFENRVERKSSRS